MTWKFYACYVTDPLRTVGRGWSYLFGREVSGKKIELVNTTTFVTETLPLSKWAELDPQEVAYFAKQHVEFIERSEAVLSRKPAVVAELGTVLREEAVRKGQLNPPIAENAEAA